MRPPIIISGGGIIGSYISSRLSRHNIKNYVVEKRPQLLEKSNKIRTLTLNKNSIELLEKEGVIIKNQNVTNINVFDEDENKLTFNANELKLKSIAKVVVFDDLQHAIETKINKNIIYDSEISKINQKNSNLDLEIKNHSPISASLLIGSEGRNSNVASLSNIKKDVKNYHQTALTFLARIDLDEHTAIQYFSDNGIFAILPIPVDRLGNNFSIVWSIDSSKLLLNTKDFVNENITFFEKKLDQKINIGSEVLNFNLSSHHFYDYTSGLTVLIGDAAHSIHPLAGQGINLGLADADILCEELIKTFNNVNNDSISEGLKSYELRRKTLNKIMRSSMDLLLLIFSNKYRPINFIRAIGLKGLNKSNTIKNIFIKHALGEYRV